LSIYGPPSVSVTLSEAPTGSSTASAIGPQAYPGKIDARNALRLTVGAKVEGSDSYIQFEIQSSENLFAYGRLNNFFSASFGLFLYGRLRACSSDHSPFVERFFAMSCCA